MNDSELKEIEESYVRLKAMDMGDYWEVTPMNDFEYLHEMMPELIKRIKTLEEENTTLKNKVDIANMCLGEE